MTTYFLEPPGQLLDAAKQAAVDAVSSYGQLNRYTIGIAVQAAAAVLRTDMHPPSSRLHADTWDVVSAEVSPRLQLLESVADAARRAHTSTAHETAEACSLCAALRQLEHAS
ncbi:MAG TPA: hypothetical protein VM143_13445 [Acidimicrobiales bacterium]|nr:hypothetical protein [Acidimicrobiales bacterium]